MDVCGSATERVNESALIQRATLERGTSGAPSVVLGTSRAGSVLEVTAAGWSDAHAETAATPEVGYRIGSITKTFTSALLLGLVDDGSVGLDDRVEEYLPDTPLGPVSLRALLAHAGGVQREAPVDMWESMRGPDEIELRRALRRAELVDRPWTRWHYSNLGYAVLGLVVREVTGARCADLIDERLIDPLGLQNTVWTRPTSAAVGYRLDPYTDAVHAEPVMDQGAVGVGGQLWSTVTDMLTWGHALSGGRPDVLSPFVVNAMHTAQVMVDPSAWTIGWGLGLILERRGNQVVAGHTGAMPGFVAALSLDRATASVSVALSNVTRGVAVGAVAADLLDELIISAPVPDVRDGGKDSSVVPVDVEDVLGRWWSEADETVFTWRGGALHARLVSAPAAESRFEQLGRDEFRAVAGRFTGERLNVRRNGQGEVEALVWATYPFTRAPR